MRGRLTIDRVNAALDELAAHAEANAALVAACRKNKVALGEKKHGQWLMHNIAVSAYSVFCNKIVNKTVFERYQIRNDHELLCLWRKALHCFLTIVCIHQLVL